MPMLIALGATLDERQGRYLYIVCVISDAPLYTIVARCVVLLSDE